MRTPNRPIRGSCPSKAVPTASATAVFQPASPAVAYVAGRAVVSKAIRHPCSASPALGLVTDLVAAWVGGGGATM